MAICSLCKKKVSFWNSYEHDGKNYCGECWKKHQDKITGIKAKVEKEEKATSNLERHERSSNLNWTKWVLHVAASISFLYALWGLNGYVAESAPQETVLALWQIKWILVAIFFELGALNYK